MADADEPDPLTGQTVELAVADLRERLPAGPEDLRNALPGIEPDRRNTDWGRSERVERLVDRTLYGFLYHYWFRVEVEGIENVPSDGGAMLMANSGGAIPPDAAMIAKAISEQHPRARALHVATDHTFAGVPGLGMLATKLGVVLDHPANVHRLLFDERQLVLVFPEGPDGSDKGLAERYRLRRFGGGGYIQTAMRAGAPIVPVAVVGAEEAMPVLARGGVLRRLARRFAVPVTPLIPLPAKFRIRFLEPVITEGLGSSPWDDSGLVHTLSEDIRALVQDNLLEMLADRRSVWLG